MLTCSGRNMLGRVRPITVSGPVQEAIVAAALDENEGRRAAALELAKLANILDPDARAERFEEIEGEGELLENRHARRGWLRACVAYADALLELAEGLETEVDYVAHVVASLQR